MTPSNDWQIKKCLVVSISLLLAMLGLIGLAALGFDVPVLRQTVGFVFLTFVPGMLILKILKIHNISIIESLLYSAGLSLVFVMAVGVVANFVLPPLGISHPIALAPLLVTFTVLFLILCFLVYVRDKNFRPANPPTEDSGKVARPSFFANLNPYLLAILLPLLAILGATLVNSYQNNTLLFALIFIVIVITGLVAFNKFIPPRVYPFMIFMMAIALIYQTTLISSNLVGSDIHMEYYFAKLVVENGLWNATIAVPLNSCLSIVMLGPIYALLLNMDIVWLFKVIYPLFFCLVPLGLFYILRLQIKPRYAFLAAFFFISMPMFFMDMAQLARQQVSELFFVLVILLLVGRKLTLIQRTTLVLIFGFGVVVSHYGMGTGYIGYLIFGALVLIFIRSRPGRTLWQWLVGKSRSLPADLTSAGAFNKKALAVIVGISLVFMLGYYSVVASGTALSGVRVVTGIVQSTTEQIYTPPITETPPVTKVPPAPILHSPQIWASPGKLTVRLEWNTPASATSYRLQISPDSDFTKLIIDETGITDTYYNITSGLNWNARCYCRVNASNENGTSEWSRFQYFQTPVAEPTSELPGFIQSIVSRLSFLERLTQTAIGLDFPFVSLGGKIWRIFQYLVELCLIVGFFRLIFRPERVGKFKAEYISLTIASVLILLGIFVLPTMSYGMGTSRIWQITLLLMSPLFLFGGEVIAYGLVKLARVFRKTFASSRLSLDNPFLLQSLVLAVLIPYFIFNSGVVFELSRSQTTDFINMPYSIALSSYRVDVTTTFTKQDTTAADWLSKVAEDDYTVYADAHGINAFVGRFEDRPRMAIFPIDIKDIPFLSYIYFRAWNIEREMLTFPTSYAARQSISFNDILGLTQLVESGSRIYNNGGAQVLLPSERESKQ